MFLFALLYSRVCDLFMRTDFCLFDTVPVFCDFVVLFIVVFGGGVSLFIVLLILVFIVLII